MALPQETQNATEARLEALSLREGAVWARKAREDALARLRAMGLPGRRDEYWRFTRPDDLNLPQAPEAAVFHNDEVPPYNAIDRLRVVFRDGVFDADASDDLSGEGIEIERLETAMATDIHWSAGLYGVLEERGQTPVRRPFAALNSAFATDGIVIRATGHVSKPVNLTYLHEDPKSDAILHFVIRVEAGADLTVLENGPAAARFNKCMEVDIAEGGAFHHVRTQGRDHERRAVTHIFARLAEEERFQVVHSDGKRYPDQKRSGDRDHRRQCRSAYRRGGRGRR